MQTLQGTAKSYINKIRKEYLSLENARKEKFTIKEAKFFNVIKGHKDKELGLKGVHLNLPS